MSLSSAKPEHPAWPHRWAWLLACATFPLVWWGGVVTVTGSGMAFPDWLTSDGVFMPLYPWLSSTGDKFIEHGHRLLGMAAGMLTIALLVSVWLAEPRRWVRWLSVGLLAGVVLQGILGGLRVTIDERSPENARVLAIVHGCTGPFFFAACAAMVAVTSRRWREVSPAILAGNAPDSPSRDEPDRGRRPRMGRQYSPASGGILRLATLTAVLAYLQLVVGAIVRHSPLMLGDGAAALFQIAVYFHVLLAVAVTVHVLLLAHKCFWRRIGPASAAGLGLLAVAQLLLGVATWMVKYGMPAWAAKWIGETGHFNRASDAASAAIISGHGAVGSLIVALSVVLALQVGRQVGLQSPAHRHAPRLAGGSA